MYTGYSQSEIKIKHKKADVLYYKGDDQLPQLVEFEDGEATLNNLDAGYYMLQFMFQGEVLSQDTLQVKQNLAYATSSYDPMSPARKILEAIDAYLAGRATEQMKKVQIGDKLIEYSSYDELMKWREYFAKIVRKEEGRPSQVKLEKLYYRELI